MSLFFLLKLIPEGAGKEESERGKMLFNQSEISAALKLENEEAATPCEMGPFKWNCVFV